MACWRRGNPAASMQRSSVTDSLFTNATASSLDAVAYGLAFLDLPRLITGGILPFWKDDDRGRQVGSSVAAQGINKTPMR